MLPINRRKRAALRRRRHGWHPIRCCCSYCRKADMTMAASVYDLLAGMLPDPAPPRIGPLTAWDLHVLSMYGPGRMTRAFRTAQRAGPPEA